jgi:hypothetical protein
LGRNGLVNVTDGGVLTCEHNDCTCGPIDDSCTLVMVDINTYAIDGLRPGRRER